MDGAAEADVEPNEPEVEAVAMPARSEPRMEARAEPRVEPPPVHPPEIEEPLPAGILPENASRGGGFRFMERFRAAPEHAAPTGGGSGALSREDIRRLQSTLFELLECKRLLDQTR